MNLCQGQQCSVDNIVIFNILLSVLLKNLVVKCVVIRVGECSACVCTRSDSDCHYKLKCSCIFSGSGLATGATILQITDICQSRWVQNLKK